MSKFTLALDSSQISTYLKCPRRWFYAYSQSLQRKAAKRDALDRGSLIHTLLELYYTELWAGKTTNEALLTVRNKIVDLHKEYPQLTSEVLSTILIRFAEYSQWSANDNFTVGSTSLNGTAKPAVETGFSIPLYEDDDSYYVLEGKIDLIGCLSGVPIWIDHKSQDRSKALYGESIQFKNYALATGINRGMINYFRLQKTPTASTFERSLVYFSDEKLRFWKQELLKIYKRVHRELIEGDLQHNWSACDEEYYWPCQFTDICEEVGQPARQEQIIQMNYQVREKWIPWASPSYEVTGK